MIHTELRIGNIIALRDGEVMTITSVSAHSVNSVEVGYIDGTKCYALIEMQKLNPIPITEEWLIKFGFLLKDTNFDGGHHYHQLSVGGINFVTPFECESEVLVDGVDMDIEIKYVHQLQNLYFALTGKELILKETE